MVIASTTSTSNMSPVSVRPTSMAWFCFSWSMCSWNYFFQLAMILQRCAGRWVISSHALVQQVPYHVAQAFATCLVLGVWPPARPLDVAAIIRQVLKVRVERHYLEHVFRVGLPIGCQVQQAV